jgi:hypothetical protein
MVGSFDFRRGGNWTEFGAFSLHEERVKEVVGRQLSSLNPSIAMDPGRKPGPERIQNIMAALG